jgi:DNA (cytosine-5)-methyltransferase 1
MQAGWEVVGAVEWDPHATITYLCNLGSYPVNIHYAEPADKERLNKVLEKNFKASEKARSESKDKSKFDIAIGSMLSGSGHIKHHPEQSPVRNFWFGDIRKIKGQDILDALGLQQGDIDCICGGPPCQGFSAAGKQNVMDPRNSLVFEYGRMILEIQPKTFVMENVPGILSMITPEGIPVVDALSLMLSKGGYGTYEALKKTLLNTAGCGAGIKGNPEKIKRPSRYSKTVKQEPVKNPDIAAAEQLSLF